MASRAARSKPSKEIATVKDELRGVIRGVQDGSMDRGTGAVISQIFNTLLRTLEIERKWRESDVLEERVRQLEESKQRRGMPWEAWTSAVLVLTTVVEVR
jgi:hypothetical protein